MRPSSPAGRGEPRPGRGALQGVQQNESFEDADAHHVIALTTERPRAEWIEFPDWRYAPPACREGPSPVHSRGTANEPGPVRSRPKVSPRKASELQDHKPSSAK